MVISAPATCRRLYHASIGRRFPFMGDTHDRLAAFCDARNDNNLAWRARRVFRDQKQAVLSRFFSVRARRRLQGASANSHYGSMATCICLTFAILFCAACAKADTEVGRSLTFGVVPQQSATRLAEEWGPLLAEIGRRASVQIVFRTAPTIPAFEEHLGKGAYDLAYMNPYHYVVFHDVAGYRALAREKNRRLSGVVVVRADSSYRVLSDLAGKSLALPAPAAFAASILPQSEFARLKIPIDVTYVSSHDSVYRNVAAGLAAAGGGIQRTLAAAPAEVRAVLRVLAETPPYTPHAIAVHPRVNHAVSERLTAVMVALDSDQVGRKVLETLKFSGIMLAKDADWNDIRALNIRSSERVSKP